MAEPREPTGRHQFIADDENGDGEVASPVPSRPGGVRIAVSDKFMGALLAVIVGGGSGLGAHFLGSQGMPSSRDHAALEDRVHDIEAREHAREVVAAHRDEQINARLDRLDDKLVEMSKKLDEALARKNR